MKTITLYGELGKRFGKHHRFDVRTAAEAIRALKANCKGFERFLCEAHQHGMGFRMFVGRGEVKDYPQIHDPAGATNSIRLVPVIAGAKSGVLSILAGVVLIAAAVAITVVSAGSLSPLAAQLVTAAGFLGGSLVIQGVATLLTGAPDAVSDEQKKTSHLFNGPVNTTLQGKAVPVGYGRLIIGAAIISAGIQTYEVTP